jgi:hypothetical protein
MVLFWFDFPRSVDKRVVEGLLRHASSRWCGSFHSPDSELWQGVGGEASSL